MFWTLAIGGYCQVLQQRIIKKQQRLTIRLTIPHTTICSVFTSYWFAGCSFSINLPIWYVSTFFVRTKWSKVNKRKKLKKKIFLHKPIPLSEEISKLLFPREEITLWYILFTHIIGYIKNKPSSSLQTSSSSLDVFGSEIRHKVLF